MWIKCTILFIVLAQVYGSFIVEPGPRVPPTKGEIWPKPKEQTTNDTFYIVRPSFLRFENVDYSCDILDAAVNRYTRIIASATNLQRRKLRLGDVHDQGQQRTRTWRSDPRFEGFLNVVKVELKAPCERLPYLYMDEAYNFTLKSSNATLESFSVWGILRGLESFAQMLTVTDDTLLRINTTTIHDAPRFSHRGLLLDTSRHYMTPFTINQVLDGMAYNKLNVFHWHIVDDQSFPYQSAVYPELSARGAYHSSMTYTPNDVQKIIEYARLRGIRVLVEIDTPGHTRSWGIAHPEILTACQGDLLGKYGPLDPTIELTYTFLENLWKELVEVFPDQYVHIGGDEVEFTCWKSNPNITGYMKQHNLTTFEQLEEKYIQRVVNQFDALNESTIVWQEVYVNGVTLPNGTVVHVWTGDRRALMHNITKGGLPTLLSECWYLDHLATGGDWEKFYNCDPHDFPGTQQQKDLVLGGEACMWSESVDNGNVLQRIFPRVSATAEKLWSQQSVNSQSEAAHRLEEHTCRMKIRGIPAAPPNGPGFCVY